MTEFEKLTHMLYGNDSTRVFDIKFDLGELAHTSNQEHFSKMIRDAIIDIQSGNGLPINLNI